MPLVTSGVEVRQAQESNSRQGGLL
jgi:hypothetical protein